MFLHLVRKELLDHLLTLRFALACAISLVIILSSVIVLAREYSLAQSDYRTNLSVHKRDLEESRDPAYRGIKVDKPLNPMQIFFRGVDERLLVTARVSGARELRFEADFEENPVVFLFLPIDLLFFIGIVMSLLALAFSYDSVSGEREQGSLKLLMSYAAPRDVVIGAKWIGGYLALIVPFILSLLCGLVAVVLFPTVELRPDDWVTLGFILLVSLLYLLAIYSLGLLISVRTRLASTSITVSLMLWVLLILIIPNTAPYIAAQIVPVSSFVQVEKQKAQLAAEEQVKFERALDAWSEQHPEFQRWGSHRWWANYSRMQLDHMPRVMDIQDRVNEQFQRSMDAQVRLAQYISRLSPFSSFAYAASDLAGTGIRDRNRFVDQLPAYRREIAEFGLNVFIAANERNDWWTRTVEGYPQFVYEESSLSERINWIDILALAVWNIVFFMGAYISFLRYDVT